MGTSASFLTDEQARMLRKSIKGVYFDRLSENDKDVLRWLMAKPREYCAADVRRDLDAIFATQDGLSVLAAYGHEKIMVKYRRSNLKLGCVIPAAYFGDNPRIDSGDQGAALSICENVVVFQLVILLSFHN